MHSDSDARRLALSCLLLGFVGEHPPGWLLDALADGLGGVVLFGSNLGDGRTIDRLTATLRAAAGREIVIALDEEGGDVTRLDRLHGSASPGAAALGHLDDVEATEQAYRAIGERLAGAGVTVDLAPVADVNTDPRNPVIGVRSFGSDPQLVARHVAAAVQGLQRSGIAACAKHFPGHGATRSDSHHEVATVASDLDELDRVELVPFAAAVAAGTRAVMTGHLVVPALDADRLATVSPVITRDVLRGRLGFGGTVLTDALEMRALAGPLGMVAGFVQALVAGADGIESGALDYPELVEQIPAAVLRALEDATVTLDRLLVASRRTADLARPADLVGADRSAPLADACWAGCLEARGSLPVLERPLVLECRPSGGMASGELPWSLAAPLADLLQGTQARVLTQASDLGPLAIEAGGRGLVVVVRDPDRHPWQHAVVDLARSHPAAVVVDVGWPAESVGDLAVVRTRGVAPGLLTAAAVRIARR